MIFASIVPILLLACAQLLVALLLVAPPAIAKPAVKLCKWTQTSVGQTTLGTVSVFLLVLLIPPVSLQLKNAQNWIQQFKLGADQGH